MRMWAKGAAGATLLTASFVAFGAGPALADVTNGNGSILGGNQVNAPISIPVNISGNGVAVLGDALAASKGGAAVHNMRGAGGGHGRTSGRHSILGGNQVNAPIAAPINACGNSVGVVGGALSGCEGGAVVHNMRGAGGGHHHTSGVGSIGGGNQVNAPIAAPINVCGNTAAVLGGALAGCQGGAQVHGAAFSGGGFHGRTDGRHSIAGGNQVHAPINAPINVCGNAVGNALAGCQGGAIVHGAGFAGGGFHGRTSGRHSILGGNQVHAPITAPIDACGNAAAVIGRSLAACQGSGIGAPGTPGAPGAYAGGFHHGFGGRTSGIGSIGGGNQVHAPINAPIDVCGNAAAVIGRSLAACGAEQGGYSGYGDDCPPGYYRMSGSNGLPQLPVDPASLRSGAMPVTLGATPGLPNLTGREIAPQSAQDNGPLGTGLGLPAVGGPPKQLPPLNLTAAESSTGTPSGALMALALGGMFAASAGTLSVARRLGRRSSR